MQSTQRLSPLQKIAAKWRVIGLVAVAFARLMRRYEDSYTPGTYEQVGQLKLAVRTVHIMMIEDIGETLKTHPPQTDADTDALAHLRCIAAALLMITFVLDCLKERVLSALCWMGERGVPALPGLAPRMTAATCTILDPG